MKILLIHGDDLPWATYNRCIELQKRWTTDIVDVKRCTDTIDYDYYDVIHSMDIVAKQYRGLYELEPQ